MNFLITLIHSMASDRNEFKYIVNMKKSSYLICNVYGHFKDSVKQKSVYLDFFIGAL